VPATDCDIAALTVLLGREPRGDFEVVVRDDAGAPVVIRNAPLLEDGTPMPTRFWLVDPDLVTRVSRLESGGGVRAAEAAVDPDKVARAHARYAAERQLEAGKAWVHVHDFVRALDRAGMLSDAPFSREPYPGRSALIKPEGLRELWLQINNACNLTCTHCLVSSAKPAAIPRHWGWIIAGLLVAIAFVGHDFVSYLPCQPFNFGH